MGRTTRKLNIGRRILKESNQGSNATQTTSTHAEGSNVEETHTTSTDAQGSSVGETLRTSIHAQGSGVEETRSNPSHMEDETHESEDSHSIPSDIEAEEAHIEKEVEPKKKRGPTRMLDVWDMDDDDVIIVNLDKYGRPIGKEGGILNRFIGSMVRRKQFAPIKYTSWKEMPLKQKSAMLKKIESKFEFIPPINDTTREMLKSELNDKWKQWKTDLKGKAYDPSKTEEEVASVVPDSRVDPDQWRELVHHWFSEKAQEELKKHDNEVETSQSVQEIQSHMPWMDDIYSKVQGPEKRGPVRCMGKIPKPKKLKASLSENQELRDKVKQMQEQQNNTNAVLVNVLSLIQNRFSGEDVNDILRAARQVTDSSSSPNQTDSPNPYTNED
ncbi:uncharacterized protein LOC123918622 isoform X3 [Trifolium pratense]|uniref:uncharacterized protein LOC123918622 isoform X3 n=1 Tax=Trifolium pratense TaxID=57577 RepID=UPI001E69518B|nr:uncharacterized protein LOC123918622 isoform X3 [Trifolium pratense]